jgi:hypothetical protein
MTIRRAAISILALAALAIPASATITYSYCTSGCASTGGDYSSWQTASGSAGLTFSMSPLTFAGGGLSGGVFTDTTGAIFTGYSNATTTNSLTISGTALAQTTNGTNSGIDVLLPSNTYAVAFMLATVSGFGSQQIVLNGRDVFSTNFSISVPNATTPQFFGILSNAPITSIFVGNLGNLDGKVQINSFELGQAAPTPEGSTLALIGAGLVAIALARKRRRAISR